MRSALHRGWALAASAAVHAVVLALGLLVAGQEGAPQRGPFRLASFTLAPAPAAPATERPKRSPTEAVLHSSDPQLPATSTPSPLRLATPDGMAEHLAPPQSSAPESIATASPAMRNTERPVAATDVAYVRLLWARINANKPPAQDLAGKVLVSFLLDPQGRVTAVAIAQSSGQMLLDKLALRAVRDAAPLPPPPDGPARFTVELVFGVPD